MLNVKKLLTQILTTLSSMGTRIEGTAQTTQVATNSKTVVNKLTVPKGTWLLIFESALNIGSNHQFQSTISSATGGDYAEEQGGSSLSGIVRHNLCWAVHVTGSTVFTATQYHNAGSTITVNTNEFIAVRIG